jgi:hypothetical protein
MNVPLHLLDGLDPKEVQIVEAWWSKLPEKNMAELSALCDRRREAYFFDPPDESDAAGIPDVVGGRFLPNEDTRGWTDWRAELFDYLVCHPEFAEPQVVRIFHIGCSRHLVSIGLREAIVAWSNLTCPFESNTCPMQSFWSRRDR